MKAFVYFLNYLARNMQLNLPCYILSSMNYLTLTVLLVIISSTA